MAILSLSCFTKLKTAHCRPAIACACRPVAAAGTETRANARWNWFSATLFAVLSRVKAPAITMASLSTTTARHAEFSVQGSMFKVQGRNDSDLGARYFER